MDVLKLAELGWKLIPIAKGSKNPGSIVGEKWQQKVSDNSAVVSSWADMGLNFGVLLGSSSGIVDVEYDSDEGREIIEAACKGFETLAYKSAKSVHRIFQWDDRFQYEKAKAGFRGTEWRFGQNSAQSVIPPSIHELGVAYEWLNNAPVLRLPDSLWELFNELKNEHEQKSAKVKPAFIAPRDRTGDSIIDLARAEAES